MKTYTSRISAVACATALTTLAALSTSADQATMTAHSEKSYTGTIASVDAAGKVMDVKGPLFHKKFNLGDTCTYMFPGKINGTATDLRPGQRVKVAYENAQGVLIADDITQKLMHYEGVVQSLDPQRHLLIVRHRMADKTFQIAGDCFVALHDDKPGTLANVRTGEHVTVTYETPAGTATARQIGQTSLTFTGELTAVDLSDRTLKAKALLSTRKFDLAEGCSIVVNGKPSGHLRDLKPGDRLTISYDDINGVCVANRIAEGGPSSDNATPQTAMSH
jgi:hypothetical protein